MVTKLSVSLLKKSVHDLLFLAHKFLSFLETVRLALDVNHGAVMQDTVQDSGGNGDVGKDFVPLGESLIVKGFIRCFLKTHSLTIRSPSTFTHTKSVV